MVSSNAAVYPHDTGRCAQRRSQGRSRCRTDKAPLGVLRRAGELGHVVFQDYGVGSGFSAGKPAAAAALTVLIRAGRSSEYKRELLRRLWRLFQAATGAPDDQIVIGIQEVPPSQAMEMGQIMPEVAG